MYGFIRVVDICRYLQPRVKVPFLLHLWQNHGTRFLPTRCVHFMWTTCGKRNRLLWNFHLCGCVDGSVWQMVAVIVAVVCQGRIMEFLEQSPTGGAAEAGSSQWTAPRVTDLFCNILLDTILRDSLKPFFMFCSVFHSTKTELLLLAFQYNFNDLLSA